MLKFLYQIKLWNCRSAATHQQGSCNWSFNDPPNPLLVRVIPTTAVVRSTVLSKPQILKQIVCVSRKVISLTPCHHRTVSSAPTVQ